MLIKNVLGRLKSNSSVQVLQMWRFPPDIANVLLNNDNTKHFETNNFKLRTKLFEIIILIANYQFNEIEFKNFLQNSIKNTYWNFVKGDFSKSNLILIIFFKIKSFKNMKMIRISLKFFEKILVF